MPGLTDEGRMLIKKKLADIEDAINTHPKATSEIYWGVKNHLKTQENAGEAERSPSLGLTPDDLKVFNDYLLAGSFVSGWHAVHHDKAKQTESTHSYCNMAALFFKVPPEDVLLQFVTFEQNWRKTFLHRGIGTSPAGCGWILWAGVASSLYFGCRWIS